MQEQTEVGTNGDAVITVDSGDYLFDAGQLTVEVPHGKSVVSVSYNKPELQDYLDRQKATHSTVRYTQGAIQGSGIKHDADTDFFDVVVVSAKKRKKDAIKIEREYNRDECLAMPYEFKVKAVKAMTTFNFTVEADGDDLSEQQGNFRVTQKIGGFTIIYEMAPLKPNVRQGFENAFDSKSRVKNGDTLIESEPHYIEKAMKIFGGGSDSKNAAFISVEGGRLERGPFTPELTAEYIEQIDALIQLGIVQAICDWYGGGPD